MRVWVIATGEPAPTDGPEERLLRGGILAGVLAEMGHDVVWWGSTFDHTRKRQRFDRDTEFNLGDRLQLRLLHGPAYRRNVSVRRMANHYLVARGFARAAGAEANLPDVIHCAYPTIELSVAATAFGRKHGIPVVLDVRDLWPDIMVDLVPKMLRPLAKVALAHYFRAARRAFADATAVSGITRPFVEWGLTLAGRTPAPLDRDFPHGYPAYESDGNEISEAMERWRARGVGRDPKDFICCFFGSIGPLFEFKTVISAARNLQSKNPHIRFVLCGSGENLEASLKFAEGCENVIFPGWVDNADIRALMEVSTVGLIPYRSAPDFQLSLPNKVGEYLSGGLPVVTSLQGVLSQLVTSQDCGVTYENGDAEGLQNVLLDLQKNTKQLEILTNNAKALFKNRFAADKVYKDLADYLQEVSQQHGDGKGEPCSSRP